MSEKGTSAPSTSKNATSTGESSSSATKTKASGSPRKSRRPDHKLNQYNRKKIMNRLIESGCDAKICAAAVREFKLDNEDVAKFVNEKQQAAQDNVHEECDSICYKNINSWLEYYKEKNFQNESNYESALIMIAIADMEHHPDPKETGGVDFQKIYRFLGDVMLGNPTPELNPESKEFLGQEFENLINMANTTEGDEDTKDLHANIEAKSKELIPELSPLEKKRRREFGSLDPMGIDSFISSTDRSQKPT